MRSSPQTKRRLNRARTVSISCGEAELASGTLADVCRRGSGEGILTKPLGLHPGDTVAVQLPGLRCRGVIREKALEMDTGGESWKQEYVAEAQT